MSKIGYGYGSEWHLLRYLGYHRDYFTNKLKSEIPAFSNRSIHWLDFNFSSSNDPLAQDSEHKTVEILKCDSILEGWKKYWPQSGNAQNWDAIAVSINNEGVEWIFTEAKSHRGEVKSDCAATSAVSLKTIEDAFIKTINKFDLHPQNVSFWFKDYYQFCNRLAFLNYLIEKGINAHLLFIYFYDDNIPDSPKSKTEWDNCLNDMYAHIGIDTKSLSKPLNDCVHKLFLSTNPNKLP